MPCTDVGGPTGLEIRFSKVLALLHELDTGHHPGPDYGNGNVDWARAGAEIDGSTRDLCERLKREHNTTTSNRSLELQIWWRDHQKQDRLRIAKEKDTKDRNVKIARALGKLTKSERKLLGV